MAKIEIHEFSTGITFQGTPDSWVSTGDKTWMNSTLVLIPQSVEMDISAGLFEIAEGRFSKTPALIGREVEYQFEIAEGRFSKTPALIGREVEYQGDPWSVLAVATPIQDKFGRKFSGYRYFLTQGLGHLPDLISWYIKVANKPVYNPFDHKQVGQPAIYDNNQTSKITTLSKFQDLLDRVVIPYDR